MSIESLWKWRAQTVEALMMELAQIAQALAHSEARYRECEAAMQTDAETYGRHTQEGLTVEALLEWQARLDSHQATVSRIRQEIDHGLLSWQRTSDLLVEARQECKLLERVIERREAATCAESLRQEQRAMDEAASRRAISGKGPRS